MRLRRYSNTGHRQLKSAIFQEEKPVNPASAGITCLIVLLAVAAVVMSIT